MADQPELGIILKGDEKRDAVHVAIMPVIAAHAMPPGSHVGFLAGSTTTVGMMVERTIGIVDPFIQRTIAKGECFYLWLYPKSITTLRHVWSHALVPDEAAITDGPTTVSANVRDRAEAVERLQRFADCDLSATYEELIEATINFLDTGDYWYGPRSSTFSGGEHIYDGFWDDFEVATGRKVMTRNRDHFFACSC